MNIDALVLNDAGGVLGALSAAALAALATTRLPKVTARQGAKAGEDGEEGEEGEGGGEAEIELDEDDDGEGQALEGVSGLPLIVSVGAVGKQLVADMSVLEEQCAAATMHVVVSGVGWASYS